MFGVDPISLLKTIPAERLTQQGDARILYMIRADHISDDLYDVICTTRFNVKNIEGRENTVFRRRLITRHETPGRLPIYSEYDSEMTTSILHIIFEGTKCQGI